MKRGNILFGVGSSVELIDGDLFVDITWSKDGWGKLRLVHRIRKMLRFQTKTVILLKEDAMGPPVIIEKMSGIELHTWFGGVDFHHPPG